MVSVSDIRLEPRYEEPGGGGHLSTAASTGRTPTPSWTEGTPSYTESTYSGDAGENIALAADNMSDTLASSGTFGTKPGGKITNVNLNVAPYL